LRVLGVQKLALELGSRNRPNRQSSRPSWGQLGKSDALGALARASMALLAHPDALATNMRLLESGHELPRGDWLESRVGEAQVVHSSLRNHQLDSAISGGSLFVIDSADDKAHELMLFREALEYEHGRTWINVYMVGGEDASFGAHSDTHDTYILQLCGRKSWQVADRAGEGRLANATSQVVVLEEGDYLFVPGGTEHYVQAVGEFALHLTIVFDASAALQFQRDLTDFVFASRHVRLTRAELEGAMARVAERRKGSSLPFVESGSEADIGTVRLASRLRPMVHVVDGKLSIQAIAKSWTIESKFEPLVRKLADGVAVTWFEVRSLVEAPDAEILKWLLVQARNELIVVAF